LAAAKDAKEREGKIMKKLKERFKIDDGLDF
jgi:hypothetical protein